MEELDQLVQRGHARILNGEEQAIRDEIDYNRTVRIDKDLSKLTGLYGNWDFLKQPDQYALEKEGVAALADMSVTDPTQAQIAEWDTGLHDDISDRQTKVAILQSRIDELKQQYYTGQPVHGLFGAKWDERLEKFTSSMIPFAETIASKSLAGGNLLFDVGGSKQEAQDKLFSLPIDEFTKKIREWDPVAATPALKISTLESFAQPIGRTGENVRAALTDVLPIAGEMYTLVRGASNPIRFMAPVNRDLASSTAMSTVMNNAPAAGGSVQMYHAVDVMLPSNASGLADLSVGLSGDVLRKLQTQQEAIAEAMRLRQMGGRLSDEEKAVALEKFTKQSERRFNPNQISDIRSVGTDELSGLEQVELILGKPNGTGGWSTEAGAVNGAKRMGLLDTATHQDTSGQWFIKQRHNLAEEGAMSVYDLAEVKDRWLNPILDPHSYVPSRMYGFQIAAEGRHLKQTNILNERFLKPIAGLSGGSKKKLSSMLAITHKNEKWMTPVEFTDEFERLYKRAPSTKEQLAYYSAKQINDYDWVTRNNIVYSNLGRRGYMYTEIPSLSFAGNSKPLTDIKDIKNIRLYDLETGTFHNGIPEDKWNQMVKDGYQAHYVDQNTSDLPIAGDEHVAVFVGKRGRFKTGPLKWQQIGYREGGHRIYPHGSLFIKQGRLFTRADGTKYLLDDITHGITGSSNEAKQYARDYNELREFIVEHRKDLDAGKSLGTALDKELAERFAKTAIKDYDHWRNLRSSGNLMEDAPFEVLRDGEKTSVYRGSGTNPLADADMVDDATKFMINRNKKYVGKRGELLMDLKGQQTEVLDPFEALNTSVNNALRTGTYYDYRVSQMETWHRTFRDYLLNETPNDALFNPQFKSSTPPEVLRKANLLRNNLVRQLGIRTMDGRRMDAYFNAISEAIDGKLGLEYRDMQQFFNKDFIGAWKRWTARSFMGFFNPGQFLLQAQTAVSASLVSPLAGISSWMRLPQMRAALYASPEFVDKVANQFFKGAKGFKADSFKQMMSSMQKSGYLNVGDEAFRFSAEVPVDIGSSKLPYVSDVFTKTGRAIDKVGNLPLRETERWNRMIAYSIAYEEELRKAGTSVLKMNPAMEKHLLQRAATLNFGMQGASKTALSQGPLGVLGQFKQYGINYSQAIGLLPGSGLSTAERTRLVLGNVVLYGGASIPVGRQFMDYAIEQYQQSTGKRLDPAAIKQLQTGLIDATINYLSDGTLNTSFGTRAGLGQTWDSMFRMATDGNLVQAFVGPNYSQTKGLIGSLYNTMKFLSNSLVEGSFTADDLQISLKAIANDAIKSYSDYDKARLLSQGLLLSRSGMKLASGDDYGTPEAIASILGIPLSGEVDTWLEYSKSHSSKEDVQKAARFIVENSLRASRDSDQGNRESYAKLNAFMLAGVDVKFRDEVIMEVNRGLSSSGFYDNMMNQADQLSPNVTTKEQ
jgi:hypothetical protein